MKNNIIIHTCEGLSRLILTQQCKEFLGDISQLVYSHPQSLSNSFVMKIEWRVSVFTSSSMDYCRKT